MTVKTTSSIDHVQIRVTHETPSAASFVSLIQTDMDPVDTMSPTANNSTDCNGFSNPNNAHASDDAYATGVGELTSFSTMYKTFGFNIPSGNTITKVELLLESKCNLSGVVHTIDLGTPGTPDTCGNYTSIIAGGSVDNPTSEAVRVFDVTAQRAWVPSDFDNANLRMLVSALHGQI